MRFLAHTRRVGSPRIRSRILHLLGECASARGNSDGKGKRIRSVPPGARIMTENLRNREKWTHTLSRPDICRSKLPTGKRNLQISFDCYHVSLLYINVVIDLTRDHSCCLIIIFRSSIYIYICIKLKQTVSLSLCFSCLIYYYRAFSQC